MGTNIYKLYAFVWSWQDLAQIIMDLVTMPPHLLPPGKENQLLTLPSWVQKRSQPGGCVVWLVVCQRTALGKVWTTVPRANWSWCTNNQDGGFWGTILYIIIRALKSHALSMSLTHLDVISRSHEYFSRIITLLEGNSIVLAVRSA